MRAQARSSRPSQIAALAIGLLVVAFFLFLPDSALAGNQDNMRYSSFNNPDEVASSAALTLYNFSMGRGDSNFCLTCSFMSYFMYALAEFSYALYVYFFKFFETIAPVAIALWIGFRTAKLMIMGGEDGKGFIYGIMAKLALFCMIWIIAFSSSATTGKTFLWQATGPVYLSYAFGLSNEVRTSALGALNTGSDSSTAYSDINLGCDTIEIAEPASTFADQEGLNPSAASKQFVDKAAQAACFTERTHIMGVASGVAVALNAHGGEFAITRIVSLLLTGIIKVLMGLTIMVAYLMSAVWLIFLILDVVSRGLIMAAFSPILVMMSLFKPTRSTTIEAIKGMVGSLITSVAIAVVGILAFVLVTNTANLYNMTREDVGASQDQIGQLEAIEAQGASDAMAEFIGRLSLHPGVDAAIPMNFDTPWFWYILFCGAAIYALGKKMITMLEQIVGYRGESAFADAATKSLKTAGGLAMMGTGATAIAGSLAMKGGGKGLSGLGGAVMGAASESGNGLKAVTAGAYKGAAAKIGAGAGSVNHVLSSSNLGAEAAATGGKGMLGKTGEFLDKAGAVASKAGNVSDKATKGAAGKLWEAGKGMNNGQNDPDQP